MYCIYTQLSIIYICINTNTPISMYNTRFLMAQLHETKNIVIKHDIRGTFFDYEESEDFMVGSFDGSSMLYINDASILNNDLRNPAQHGIVYLPSRYLFVEIQTNNTAAEVFDQVNFKNMFENIGYRSLEVVLEPCNSKTSLIFKFECKMALYSSVNNFKAQAQELNTYKSTKFVEFYKLILEFEFQTSTPSNDKMWIQNKVNLLCKEYINSLLVSILEVNYPLVFNKKSRECCAKHLSCYKNLQTIKVPMTYIFKTLSYASISNTTTMIDLLTGKIPSLPL